MTVHQRRRAPGTLKSQVMAALWASGKPMTAAAVQAALNADLARNTVQTILVRLHQKSLVRRGWAGRGYEYWPVEPAASAAAAQMQAALADWPDRLGREAVLQQFAASLDDADADALRRLLVRAHQRP